MPEFVISDGQVSKVGLWHGTVIKLRDGQRYKITKLNPVNVKMIGTDGTTYTYNREAAARQIDDDQSWDGPKEKTQYELALEGMAKGLTLGTVVTFTSARLRKEKGKYVCIAMRNDGTYRFTKLGGDGGRYLRGIKANEVEVTTAE